MLPVQLNQRIQYLDILRGIAISGVLFAYVFWNLGTEPVSNWTLFDKMIDKAGSFLVDSKCYTILACLFAAGFVLHMNKTDDKRKALYVYRKRLLGLFIIGSLHALLLRNGDILAPYAILTFITSFFYAASNKTIIVTLIITFLLQALLPQALILYGSSFPSRPDANGGNYWVENFQWLRYWYSTAIFFWETTLVLLLTGLILGRIFIEKKKILTNKQLFIVVISGIVASTLSYLLMNVYPASLENLPDIGHTHIVRSVAYNFIDMIHKIGLASAYASIVFLSTKKIRLTVFANLGRMSLTNYVLQAVIIIPVCLFFNLFNHITPTLALIITIGIWIFQILFSNWWLKNFRFGPLEWLLRTFTYGKTIAAKKEKECMELLEAPAIIRKM
jgi:uncharacterized protein